MPAKTFRTVAACMALLCSCIAAQGADLASEQNVQSPPGSDWEFQFTTYGWLPWISGDVAIKGRSFSVEVDPNDVLNALDWGSGIPAWFSYAEARNGPFSIFNDIVYSRLAGSADFARTGPGGRLTLRGDVNADFEQTIIELGGTYEVWSEGEKGVSQTAIDVLGGGRYWRQDASVSADLSANLNLAGLEIDKNRVIAREGAVDWIDPFFGARLRKEILPGQSLSLRGDIGGFGVGSDFTWQVIAAYDVQIAVADRVTIDGYLGYRALAVDYSQGSGVDRYDFDAIMQGPVLGVTFRF